MAIIGFKSKNDEVLNRWIHFADGFTLPPKEFYEAVEPALEARKIPSFSQTSLKQNPIDALFVLL